MSRFDTTQWSIVVEAQGSGGDARAALESLCRTYRPPVLAYICSRGYRSDVAEDLTQSFFTRFLERGHYPEAGPARGRFRAYLLTAIKHFLVNAAEEANAVKRGGRIRFESIDADASNSAVLPAGGDNPEQVFEQAWALAVLDSALHRLRKVIAGPSEVAIITDESCDPAWVAADLLAQAEHDEMARVWLICWSSAVAASVFDEVQVQLQELDRSEIARSAIDNHSVAFIVADENAAIELANILAAEHVEVLMSEPDRVADGIRNAGALFVGRYAPTVVGDYFAGPSHVLPTGRTARFFSPLGVPDFMKRTSLIRYSGRAIEQFGDMIEKFATQEGLTAHARSIAIRRHQA